MFSRADALAVASALVRQGLILGLFALLIL